MYYYCSLCVVVVFRAPSRNSMLNPSQRPKLPLPDQNSLRDHTLELPALPNIAHIEHAHFLHPAQLQRVPQLPRRLQHILLRQDPGAPMHRQRPLTPRSLEDLHRVPGIGVHGAHDEARHVGAYWDEAEIEGTAEPAYIRECGADGEVGPLL